MSWPVERLRLFGIDARVVMFRAVLPQPLPDATGAALPRFAKIPGHARLIVHHADAEDALERGHSFGVPYLAKMEALGGAFVLGLDDGAEHARLRGAVQAAIAGSDFAALHRDSFAAAPSGSSPDRNRIEVVGELTDPVLAFTIGRHLGVGERRPPRSRRRRTVFRDIFINWLKDPRVGRRAAEAAGRLRVRSTRRSASASARRTTATSSAG